MIKNFENLFDQSSKTIFIITVALGLWSFVARDNLPDNDLKLFFLVLMFSWLNRMASRLFNGDYLIKINILGCAFEFCAGANQEKGGTKNAHV